MQKRKKFKTSERNPSAHRTDDVLSSNEFVAKRKEDALALAQLAYDMFVEKEMAEAETEGQDNEQSNTM